MRRQCGNTRGKVVALSMSVVWGASLCGAQQMNRPMGAMPAQQATTAPAPRAASPAAQLDAEAIGRIAGKKRRDRLIRLACDHPTWALGFADEVWWSRLAQPDQHGWVASDQGIRLQELARRRRRASPRNRAEAVFAATAAEGGVDPGSTL